MRSEIERLRNQSPINSPYLKKKHSLPSGESVNLNLSQSSTEVNVLMQQNNELNDGISILQDEVHYLKLREKKIMYLMHLL
jgi:hypothetical protein